MNFKELVQQIPNTLIAKRIATAYVADYRRLSLDELKTFLIKTMQQYISYENILESIKSIQLDNNRAIRIIAPIFIRDYLLDQDDFISSCKETDTAILNYEKAIIDESNNFDISKISNDLGLFKFMLDTAWAYNDDISVDEKNLIEAVRKYLNISIKEQHMLEAKSGRFPNRENIIHTYDDIDSTRKALQSKGLLMSIKNADGELCDVIPTEIAKELRKIFNIEIRSYGYEKLVDYVIKKTKKQYLIDIVSKFAQYSNTANICLSNSPTVVELKEVILKYINPSTLLGGYHVRDGLDVSVLSNWCAELGLNISGTKTSLIDRILDYYDSIRKIEIKSEDKRESLIHVFHQLASRDLKYLHSNNIITKDLQCEHLFEDATNYIFEKMLFNKPLTLAGTDHPDGKLSFKDKYIMWDNKSKESPVNLKDHIQQFDRYIKTSDKDVAVFMVIGPEFSERSVQECVDYSLNNDTLILLITADELLLVAKKWAKSHNGESFNLGYFKQNGRFDISLLNL